MNNIRSNPKQNNSTGTTKFEYSVEDAWQQLAQFVNYSQPAETITLNQAYERILYRNITATLDFPVFTNSAMDGYAYYTDAAFPLDRTLKVIGHSLAGKPYEGTVGHDECVLITTGAKVPSSCNTVVIKEKVQQHENHIHFQANSNAPGQYIRYQGEDIKQGDTLLTKGDVLHAANVGLLAMLGIHEVEVYRPIKIALFSTGDELKEPGTTLLPGQIYDANRYTIAGLLKKTGAIIEDYGIIADQADQVEHALSEAAQHADIIITSGGVSVGEADLVKKAVEKLGELKLWRIKLKPGRPLAWGKIKDKLFFGLPGNPVSAMVTCYLFVIPALAKIMGQPDIDHLPKLRARCTQAITKTVRRMEFQRGIAHVDHSGEFQVKPTGPQDSHRLSSMSQANCFIVLPEETQHVAQGEAVQFILLSQFL